MPSQPGFVRSKSVYNQIIGGATAAAIGVYVLTQKPGNEAIGWILVLVGAGFAISAWRSVSNARLLLRYHNNPRKTVEELINTWQPRPARLEADYEKSLHSFLKSKLTFAKLTRQYGSARVKCDIAVNDDVFIELKNGLRTTNKLQRLIGQIELYSNEWKGKPVIILLLGESQDDLLHDLNRTISKYDSVRVIQKAAVTAVEQDEDQNKGLKGEGTERSRAAQG
jgi:hypothetical protein